VFGYFVISVSAVVMLVGLALFMVGSIIITHMDSENAADIITAIGKSFPLKGLWWRRK
jgi:uncharacterized membrane protein YgdD (TMEM256/DUF423 family)